MKSLKQLAREISGAMSRRSRYHRFGVKFVKIVLVGFFTLLAGAAQFLSLQDGDRLGFWNYVGILSCLVVFLGAVFLIFTESDPDKELDLAQEALERARDVEAYSEYFIEYERSAERLTELIGAFERLRDVLERTAVSGFQTEQKVLDDLMTTAGRHLSIAMAFAIEDHWTLCVYKAEIIDGSTILVCRAHERAIRCPIAEARSWPVGVGVSGVAFANRSEIVVPDMAAEGIGNLYGVPGLARSYDGDRYRSMVVVPVMVGADPIPWGVVIGTSSVEGHFTLDEDEGLSPVKVARTLAGMVALVVALSKGAATAPTGST